MLLSSLLDNTSTYDITFKTSNGSVSGHRVVIAAGSPVLNAMLYGGLKESTENEITLPSIDAETFKALVSFIYTGKINIDPENCYKILDASNYFNISVLLDRCVNFIETLLNSENVCTIAVFASDKIIDSLLKICNDYMMRNIYKIIHTPDFKHLPVQSIIEICSSSNLYISEIDLFLAIKEWLSSQNSLPEGTINILNLIRYSLINSNDLIEKVYPTGLVDPTLYHSALEYRLSTNKRFKGLQEQIKLREYYF